jgi:hypothetical protein
MRRFGSSLKNRNVPAELLPNHLHELLNFTTLAGGLILGFTKSPLYYP